MALIVVTKTEKVAGRIRVQVIESYREGKKVKQKLVRNIGTAHSQEELEIFLNLGNIVKLKEEEKRLNLKKLFDDLKYLEKNPNKEIILPPVELKNLQEKKRVHEGIADIYGELYDSLNFNQILIDSKYNKILKEVVLARIQNPKSKLKTCEIFEKDCNKSIDVNSYIE